MTDQTEEIEIEVDHPWVQASLVMDPEPVPFGSQIVPVELPVSETKTKPAGMLTLITPVGTFTVFMGPEQLVRHVQQCAEVLQYMEHKQQSGLVVPTQQQAADLINMENKMKKGRNDG